MRYNGNASIQARKLYGDETKLVRRVKPTSAEASAESEADGPIAEGPRKQGLFNL